MGEGERVSVVAKGRGGSEALGDGILVRKACRLSPIVRGLFLK